jgi:hypothetical protein
MLGWLVVLAMMGPACVASGAIDTRAHRGAGVWFRYPTAMTIDETTNPDDDTIVVHSADALAVIRVMPVKQSLAQLRDETLAGVRAGMIAGFDPSGPEAPVTRMVAGHFVEGTRMMDSDKVAEVFTTNVQAHSIAFVMVYHDADADRRLPELTSIARTLALDSASPRCYVSLTYCRNYGLYQP